MKKKAYKAIKVNKLNMERLSSQVFEKEIVVGIDVAKEDFFCNLMSSDRESICTIKWKHPIESRTLLDLIESLPAKSINVAMEPSGRYGDPIRYMFNKAGIPVHRISPKRSHDAQEVFDGIPSLHDAKSAFIISRLYFDGISEPWSMKELHERDIAAVVSTMDMLQKQFNQETNRLESLLARYWPELSHIIGIDSVSFLELLIKYGSPADVAEDGKRASLFLKKTGKKFLKIEKIDAIIESAGKTLGIPMSPCEKEELIYLADHARSLQKRLKTAKKRVENLSKDIESVKNMSVVIGKATAAVVVSSSGDPLKYDAPSQYLKSMGLNLKEKSSGKHQGKLTITKRGSNKARRWLYFTVLRSIRTDDVIKAWYQRKIARDGGVKMKAIIAIMRKLVLALWHVARGATFDSKKLFNIQKLGFTN